MVNDSGNNTSSAEQYRDQLGSKSQSPSSNQNSIQYQYTTVDDSPRDRARFISLQKKFDALGRGDIDISSRKRIETLDDMGKVESFATFGRVGSITSIQRAQMSLNANFSSSVLSGENPNNMSKHKINSSGPQIMPMSSYESAN